MNKAEEPRKVIEDIAVTPFFKRHSKHKPLSIKLHAEITENDDFISIMTEIPGYREDLVDVSASSDTIDINLHSGKKTPIDVEKSAEEISFHNSYLTPSEIDPESLEVSHKGNRLIVKALKLKG